VLYDISENANTFIGLTRASRTPSVEELFANVDNLSCGRPSDDEMLVLHAATNLLEIGNPNLAPETSNNFEFGYRLFADRVTGEISVYANQIDDYIYLNVNGSEFEEQLIGQYEARDAQFRGVEGRVIFNVLASDRFSMNWSLTGDVVNAEFDAGGKVPRIPAAKLGTKLEFFGEQWTVHAHAFKVSQQDDIGEFELATDGYTLLSVYADYHWDISDSGELKLFLRCENLLDEEIRNHASLLKSYAPEAGRSFRIGLRYRH
jgi:iron complex outermembrane receptor protein